jgi:hypothetical protein
VNILTVTVVNSDKVGNGDGEEYKILDCIVVQASQHACSVLFSLRGLKHAPFPDALSVFYTLAVEHNGVRNQ